MHRLSRGVLAGLTFIAFGGAFAVGALGYSLGTTARMGPGFFPLLLGAILVVFGVLVALRPVEGDEEPLTRPSWRAVALLLGGLLAFGLAIRPLGLIPAVFLASVLAAFASRETRPLTAVGLAVALTVVSVLVFVIGLKLTLPLLGPLVPRL
jgi:hypothetical protein